MKYEKCKVVMLPTEKADWIISYKYGDYTGLQFGKRENLNSFYNAQHLYILSDEEIKPSLYDKDLLFINPNNNLVTCARAEDMRVWANSKKFGKVIATTDPSLELPRPSDDFIKKYCLLGGIDEVMVEYEWYLKGVTGREERLKEVEGLVCPPSKDALEYFKDRLFVKLKVAPDNTITIKGVKNMWSKEEVIKLFKDYEDILYKGLPDIDQSPLEWITKNL